MEFEGKPPFKRTIQLAGDHLTLLADKETSAQKFSRAPALERAPVVAAASPATPKSAEQKSTRAPAISGGPTTPAASPQKPKMAEYSAVEAAKHVGETATVIDNVDDVHQTTAGTIFINMGGAYPNNVFTVFIPATSAADFRGVQTYKGAKVKVSGKIGMYKEKPQIVVTDRSQLATVQASPSPP